MKNHTRFSITVCCLLLPISTWAQQANVNLDWDPQKNKEGLRAYSAPLNSPEVHDDQTVTFRMQAPDAESVSLSGGTILTALKRANQSVPFTKGEDGIWTVTVGPLEPDIYAYAFTVDGATVTDPSNTVGSFANQPPYSEVVIHGDGPSYYDAQNVPHGKITRHFYHSNVTDGERELFVYTPPGYDPDQTYPVLYLVGGSGGVASNWINVGRVNFIMDNLLAEGNAVPMIIAIPNNQVLHRNDPQHSELTFDLFEEELREHVVPLVDQEYSTRPNPKGRALSGLSMGGRHTMFIGLRSLDLFGSLGILSAGDNNAEEVISDFLNDPEANEKVDYLFVGQGGAEAAGFFNARVAGLVNALKAHDIEHEYYVVGESGHDWPTWRGLLHDRFLPNLWKNE